MAESASRDPSLDALRGFSLLGILAANFPFFGMPGGVAGAWWSAAFPGGADFAAAFFIRAALENTFILIFSFLFGYGAACQLESGDRTWFRRRLIVLALFGAVHALLLWAGDILLAYAIIGLALPYAVRWPLRKLLTAAVLAWGAGLCGNAAIGALLAYLSPPLPDANAALALFRSGDFLTILQVRLLEWAEFYFFGIFVLAPLIAAAFFLGVYAKKWLAEKPFSALRPLSSRTALIALFPALAGSLAYGWLATAQGAGDKANIVLELVLRAIAAPSLAAVIFTGALWLFSGAPRSPITKAFALNGRMSLTIYIAQSAALAALFHGYAFGQYGNIGPAWGLAVSCAIFLAMTALAALWLRSFPQGPLEILAKTITGPRRDFDETPAGAYAAERGGKA